ncbi:hypothetical protein L1987_40471 [Smallanthus sonchifolius]|uniref:Uncharacterized protein n=1 Tax=Smallanthus sonchifolius TaxID=185202 RepID=A0ACB9GU76_9ASTR|nr:hypothetical protein L1987_40471 [Smallanthus sonchifolius]
MNDVSKHNETLKIVEKQSNKNIICLVKDQHQENDVKIAFDQKEAFLSLKKSGKLDDLLLQGKEFILSSNILAEVVDPSILLIFNF